MNIPNSNLLKENLNKSLISFSEEIKVKIDEFLLDLGLDKIIQNIQQNINKPTDLDDYNLFSIPEDINNSIQGFISRDILIEADTRSLIVKVIENHLSLNGFHIDSISQQINKQWVS